MNDYTYLGDGVYARFDGYQVVITTDPNKSSNCIALEDNVMNDLIVFWKKSIGLYE
jgi:hypothetical protein